MVPGSTCERAGILPDTEVGATLLHFLTKPFFVQMMRIEEKGEVSHSVDCGNGHFFCWECLGEAHAPVACHKYQVVRSELNINLPSSFILSYVITSTVPNKLLVFFPWLMSSS